MSVDQQTNTYWIVGRMLLIAVFSLGQCVLSGCNDGTDTEPRSRDAAVGLHLRLETDFSKSEYLLGETVIVRMYLKNTTDKDIVICAWPSRAENLFVLYDNDKRIPHRDIVTFDRPVSKDKSFITIKSGAEVHFVTPEWGEEWQEEFPSQYFDKIGRWEFKTTYFYDFSGERFGLNAWQGELSSNVLSLSIK